MITDQKILENILLYCSCFHPSDITRTLEREEDPLDEIPSCDSGRQDEKKEDAQVVLERRTSRNSLFESNWREDDRGKEVAEALFVINYKPATYAYDKKDDEAKDSATLKFFDPEKRPQLFLLPWEDGVFRDPVRDTHLKTRAEKVSDAVWYKCDTLGMIWSVMDKRMKVYGKIKT